MPFRHIFRMASGYLQNVQGTNVYMMSTMKDSHSAVAQGSFNDTCRLMLSQGCKFLFPCLQRNHNDTLPHRIRADSSVTSSDYKEGWLFLFSKSRIEYHKADICVTVLGYPPLSRPVAWRPSSSPIGLGYRRYASTYLLKHIANGGPQGSHLNPPSNGASAPVWVPHMHAPPNFSIKAVCATPWGSLFG